MLLMLSVTGVDKGNIVPIIIYIVYGSRTSAQKLTSNTELTRSHNVKNVLQHTELNISLRKSRLLLATNGSIKLRKTVIPSEAISYRKSSSPESEPATRKRKSRSGSDKKKKIEEENVNYAVPHSHVNDTISHSHVNHAIYPLPASLALLKRQLAKISHTLT